MRLPFQPRPKPVTDRVRATVKDVQAIARSLPDRLESGRARALAVAGAATSAAAGFAFWRSRHEDRPSVHVDPAHAPTPWKRHEPSTDGEQAAVANVAGARSK